MDCLTESRTLFQSLKQSTLAIYTKYIGKVNNIFHSSNAF